MENRNLKGTRERTHPCKTRKDWATERRFSELSRGHPPLQCQRELAEKGLSPHAVREVFEIAE
jgi:hypothetical protein